MDTPSRQRPCPPRLLPTPRGSTVMFRIFDRRRRLQSPRTSCTSAALASAACRWRSACWPPAPCCRRQQELRCATSRSSSCSSTAEPSQTETFDPKMDGPRRHPAASPAKLATALPGVTFGTTFPKLARAEDAPTRWPFGPLLRCPGDCPTTTPSRSRTRTRSTPTSAPTLRPRRRH